MPKSSTLIAYFSLSGNTRAAAEQLASKLGADLEPIRTTGPPLRLSFSLIRRMAMCRWFGREWPVAPSFKRADDYELVVIAGPIWAGRLAAPVLSWVRANDVAATARIAILATAGGGHMFEAAMSDVAKLWHRDPTAVTVINDTNRKAGHVAAKLETFAGALCTRQAA